MKKNQEPVSGLSGCTAKHESAIAARLVSLQGAETAVQFARKCGVGESLMRKYLAGSTPGVDKAAQIAAANQVRLEWLATGEGPMREEPAPAPSGLDLDELAGAIETVEEGLAVTGRTMGPAKKAELVAAVYDLFRSGAGPADKGAILRLVKSAA